VLCRGGSDDHAAIAANLTAAFHAAVRNGPCVVRGSDRQLVPRNSENKDLGSFYADVFVTCAPEDRTGSSAHFPTVVVEVLSEHIGKEFTAKMWAYTRSAQLADYFIIESSTQAVHRYSWKTDTRGVRRLMWRYQRRGPVPVPSLGITLTFEQIYEKTTVPVILYPVTEDDETEIVD
jgi:Uma2 family endonuclease